LLFLYTKHHQNLYSSKYLSIIRVGKISYSRVRVYPVGTLAGVIEKSSTEGLGLHKHINDGLLVFRDLQVGLVLGIDFDLRSSCLSCGSLVFLSSLNGSV